MVPPTSSPRPSKFKTYVTQSWRAVSLDKDQRWISAAFESKLRPGFPGDSNSGPVFIFNQLYLSSLLCQHSCLYTFLESLTPQKYPGAKQTKPPKTFRAHFIFWSRLPPCVRFSVPTPPIFWVEVQLLPPRWFESTPTSFWGASVRTRLVGMRLPPR